MGIRSLRSPALLLTSAIGVCLLISLGVWQLKRLTWKKNLIAQVQTQQELPRIELFDVLTSEEASYRRIAAEGNFQHDAELRLLGKAHQQTMGYYLFTPLLLSDGRIIYVNRGWVANSTQDREISRPLGKIQVEGMLREKMSRNVFTPANHYESREIFTFDPQEIVQDNLIAYYIDATHIKQQGQYPIVMKNEIQLRNHHLLYAITWFTLAGGLAIVCFLFIRNKQQDDKS